MAVRHYASGQSQLVKDLRKRLSSEESKPLSQQRFAELLGVSWSTVARWESGNTPDARTRRKLMRLRTVAQKLEELVMREDRVKFLEQPHPLLFHLRPIQLLDSDEGTSAVIRLLEAAETGSFA